MKITKNNLRDILFENEDARLLIKDVVSNTSAVLYYYHDVEITVQMALDIWYRAYDANYNDSYDMPLLNHTNHVNEGMQQLYS